MPAWCSFIERLCEVAAAHPHRRALVESDSRALTYAALLNRIASLAGALREQGIGPGTLVGLALDRSSEHILGMLAAWRLGSAFLPLDSRWPDDRLAFILRDADPIELIVTFSGQAERFQRLGVRTIDPNSAATTVVVPNPVAQGKSDLAYVIYTSGSTGRPKGVAVEHRGIVNLLDAQICAFGLNSESRSLWLLHPAFDASLSDVGTARLAGAALHLERDEDLRDPAALVRRLHRRRITHLDLPPSLLGVLDPETLPDSLQTLIIGGEPSPSNLVRQWARRFRLVNVYGPTEATVCTSLCVCDADAWDQPLLGQPLPGVSYRVLDANLRPVRAGATGELCIGGVCLARGYVNRPELTAEKFITHESERLYRTGDRVLRRPDGEYVFLGRIDRQVKLRGQLVEPEEVEARLREHARIRHAAVVKRPLGPAPAPEGLVAFIVADAAIPDCAELRRFLADRLPGWMLPQRIVAVEELPRTTTGKVDLARLIDQPLSSEAAGTESSTHRPNLGSDEKAILTEIWSRLLGLPAVDLEAGFFEQGGDSLTLMQAVAAAHARGLTIPPPLLAEGRGINTIIAWLRSRPSTPGAMSCADLRADADAVLSGLRAWESTPPPSPLPATERGGRNAVWPPLRCGEGVGGGVASILLTGATGFLGSYLLGELLRRTEAEIVCLVRAPDVVCGLQRVRSTLHERIEPAPAMWERVRIVPGDLSRPHFGLAPAAWDDLAGRVDTVYHCAARVNVVLPYGQLRPDNVLAAAEVIRFAAAGRRKRVHHASTLSVFVATDRNTGRLLESDRLETTQWVHGGYAQSKWTAEQLFRRAAGRTGPITHYRLGLITGDTRTGKGAPGDFLTQFIRGVVDLGCLPPIDRGQLFLDVTPIDFAAPALAHLSLHAADREDAVFHLANPRRLSLGEIVAAIEEMGVSLEEVDALRWRERVAEMERAAPSAAAACLALCRGLPALESFDRCRTMDLFQATGVVFDMQHTLAGLRGSPIICPPPAPDLIRKYVASALNPGIR